MESEDQRPNGATDMTGSAREVMKAELEWHGVEPAATLAGQLDKAITRAGFAIVPVEPTEEAYQINPDKVLADWHDEKAGFRSLCYVIWKHMLAARQQEGQDDGNV